MGARGWQDATKKVINFLLNGAYLGKKVVTKGLLFLLLSISVCLSNLSVADELTQEERAWLNAHPVIRVAVDAQKPPFDFIDTRGLHQGLAADYLELIGQRLGVSFRIENKLPWNQAFIAAENKDVDLVSLAQEAPEHQHYLSFTETVTSSPWVIVTRNSFPSPVSLDDLEYLSVAMAEGHAVEELREHEFPDVKILSVESSLEGLRAVATGEADAFVECLAVAGYLIQQHGFINLKIAGEAGIGFHELAFSVRSDWPELLSILNKGLGLIGQQEENKLRAKWLPFDISSMLEKDDSVGSTLYASSAVAIIVVTILALLVALRVSVRKKFLNVQYGSRRFNLLIIAFIGVLVFVLTSLTWMTMTYNKREIEQGVVDTLRTVRDTSVEGLDVWLSNKIDFMRDFGHDHDLVLYTRQLLKIPNNKKTLLASPVMQKTRDFFERKSGVFGNDGFFIVSPSYFSLASKKDDNVGTLNLIARQRLDLMERVFQGETVFIPPIYSDSDPLNLSESHEKESIATMFIAAPIVNNAGKVIAAVTQRLNPQGQFSSMTKLGRIGETGETYAFDKSGLMISESRFEKHLREMGRLSTGQSSVLKIKVRNPMANILEDGRQPLTKMATSAIKGESKVDIEGYFDYRGKMVFGAWTWLDALEIGLVTEINSAEALAGYYRLRLTILAALIVSVLLSVGAVMFTLVMGGRANRSLRKSRDELENRVTERTTELAESEAQFRSLVGNMPGTIYRCLPDDEKTMLFISDEIAALSGYSASDFMGGRAVHSLYDVIHPDDVDMILSNTIDAITQRIPYVNEFRVIDTVGVTHYVYEKGQAVFDDSGVPLYLDGTIFDVTAKKISEQRLNLHRNILAGFSDDASLQDILNLAIREVEAVREHSICSVMLVDKDRRKLVFGAAPGLPDYLNAMMDGIEIGESMSSCSEAAFTGKPVIVTDILNHTSWNYFSGLIKEAGIHTCWTQPIFASDGRILGTFATYYKEAKSPDEQDLSFIDFVSEIMAVIIERKYTQMESISARQEAERANQAKSEFLSSMSHELRTPMNAILGFSQLLGLDDESPLTPNQEKAVLRITQSGKHLLTLIDEVLELARIEAGHLDLVMEEVNLCDLVKESLVLISALSDEQNISIDAKEVPCVLLHADAFRLKQVLLNLMSNAVKYNRQGGSISIDCKKTAHGMLRLYIRDTGYGISEDQLQDMFKPFNRLGAENSEIEGTGIGLVLSRQLVEAMGGSIGVDSVVGEGSSFWIEILMSESRQASVEEKNLTESVAVEAAVDLKTDEIVGHVLYIEDNPANVALMSGILQHYSNIELESVHNAELGVAMAIRDKPDLILMDINLPGMSGIEALARLRDNEATRDITVIAVSAAAMPQDIKRGMEAGFSDYLTKPFNIEKILETIGNVLAKN